MIQLVVNGQQYEVASGKTIYQIKNELGIKGNFVAAKVNGRLRELSKAIYKGCTIDLLDPSQDEEASRIYARGISFLLAKAIKDLYHDRCKLVIEYYLSGGLFARIKGRKSVSAAELKEIAAVMKDYIKRDLPFEKTTVPTSKAIQVFEEEGEQDKVELIGYRKIETFHLYHLEGFYNYFYGYMPYSTGVLKNFKLYKKLDGFMLMFTTPYQDGKIKLENQPKVRKCISESEMWAKVAGINTIADLNGFYENGDFGQLIQVCEALHEEKIAKIAQKIKKTGTVRAIRIAGPSSSGKTTFSKRLMIHLRVQGLKSLPISMDDYYMDRDKVPKDENGKVDLESIDIIDIQKINQDVEDLIAGKEVYIPHFDFVTGKSIPAKQATQIDEDTIVILEGIHGLNDSVLASLDAAFQRKIFICPFSTTNMDHYNTVKPEDIRLLRRLVRDNLTRGYKFEHTLEAWENIRKGEFKYILPYQENADFIFNSTLYYEPLVLKKYAMEELQKIEKDSPNYLLAVGLKKFLNYCLTVRDDSMIPQNSILREFIGGSCFE